MSRDILIEDQIRPRTVLDGSGTTVAAAIGLPALTTLVGLEALRALFTLAYGAGEDLGFLTAGLLVVALLAAPMLTPLVSRGTGSHRALPSVVGVLVALRAAEQVLRPIPFWLALVTVAVALVAVTLVLGSLRSSAPDGSLAAALGIALGVALDLGARATGATWDVVWRDDLWARLVTVGALALLVGCAFGARRAGLEPRGEDRGAGVVAFLVWPFLGISILYTQSPAYLDAMSGGPVALGLALAATGAVITLVTLATTARAGLPRSLRALAGLVLAACGYLLPVATGPVVLLVVLVALIAAAAALGATVGDERTAPRPGLRLTAAGAASGAVLLGLGILTFTLHTIQPLPFSNRFIPAILGLSMAFSALHRPRPSPTTPSTPTHLLGALASVAAVVGLAGALGLAITDPTPPGGAATPSAPSRRLTVVSFNINQGVTEGQLDLEELAQVVEAADPDVVVFEEVARGWSVSGMVDGMEWFRRRLGMEVAWSPAADEQFGNVVLSRLPITRAEVLPLGKQAGTQTRSAIFVTLDLGSGTEALVIGAHLQNGDDAPIHDERAESYRAILEKWDGHARTILIGDLNTYPLEVPPGWPELAIPLEAGFVTTQDTVRCTMPTSNENCPDWVFTSPDLAPAAVRIVVDRPDHRPIAADVEIPSDDQG